MSWAREASWKRRIEERSRCGRYSPNSSCQPCVRTHSHIVIRTPSVSDSDVPMIALSHVFSSKSDIYVEICGKDARLLSLKTSKWHWRNDGRESREVQVFTDAESTSAFR